MITMRMIAYLCIFFKSMSSMAQLINHIMFNTTKTNFNIFDPNQKIEYIFIFNIYIFCEIVIYGMTIFLIYGCTRSFPEAFRNFIMKNMYEPCPDNFDILINVFLVILGLLVAGCPLVGMWIETL